MAVAALVVSIVAVLLAGFGAWSAHRSARSAAQAVDLQRAQQHLEHTPRIRLEDGGFEGDFVRFVNDGPLDYDSVAFTFAATDRPGPVQALQVGEKSVTSADLGPMAVGDHRALPYRFYPESGREAGTLRLRVSCAKGSEKWTIPAEVELPYKPWEGG
jgi:hypothetical protein